MAADPANPGSVLVAETGNNRLTRVNVLSGRQKTIATLPHSCPPLGGGGTGRGGCEGGGERGGGTSGGGCGGGGLGVGGTGGGGWG